jgi:arginyl-tRNA synthetase
MHMGNERGAHWAIAWLGTCVAGYEVTREFYVNDAGNR